MVITVWPEIPGEAPHRLGQRRLVEGDLEDRVLHRRRADHLEDRPPPANRARKRGDCRVERRRRRARPKNRSTMGGISVDGEQAMGVAGLQRDRFGADALQYLAWRAPWARISSGAAAKTSAAVLAAARRPRSQFSRTVAMRGTKIINCARKAKPMVRKSSRDASPRPRRRSGIACALAGHRLKADLGRNDGRRRARRLDVKHCGLIQSCRHAPLRYGCG